MTRTVLHVLTFLALIVAVVATASCAVYAFHCCRSCCSNGTYCGNVTYHFQFRNVTHYMWHIYNVSRIVHREIEHVEKMIMNVTMHVRKMIENVTELINETRNYTNVMVMFRHGVKCRRVRMIVKHAVMLLNGSSELVDAILKTLNSTLLCRGKCVMKHTVAILNNTKLVAEELVLINSTFRCHNCTIVGKVVFGNGTRVILVNPNLTLSYTLCNKCWYVLSMFRTKNINVTINHTKVWIMLGKESPILHNATIFVEAQTPNTNVTISIVTRWCLDNLLAVKVPVCNGNKCRLVIMNFMTCRPRISINITTRVLNLTIYHGIYDKVHNILLAVNSTQIVAYRFTPMPGVVASLVVNASRGKVSTIMLTNVSKPFAVGYISLKFGNRTIVPTNVTLLPYVDPSMFNECKLCWTYINSSKTLLIHVVHHSPVGVVVFAGRKEAFTYIVLPAIAIFVLAVVVFALLIYVMYRLHKLKKMHRK